MDFLDVITSTAIGRKTLSELSCCTRKDLDKAMRTLMENKVVSENKLLLPDTLIPKALTTNWRNSIQ